MSLELKSVSKVYQTTGGPASILQNVNLSVEPGERVGILGQNGAGKSTLIRILGGSEQPTSGQVVRGMSLSWPLAFGGAFLGALTGIDNIRFVCRLYGVDPESRMSFIEEFTELGRYLREPVRTYSSGMRARLAFAVSMAIDFDCYLVDEIVAVGDDRFQRKCQFELFEKRQDKAMLIVSHSADFVRAHCGRASVLNRGHLTNFSDVEEAYHYYSRHEVSLQPHMQEKAVAEPQLAENAVEFFAGRYSSSGSPDEFEGALRDAQLHRVPVFDSCDVVGRLENSGQSDAALAIARYLANEIPTEPLFWVTLGDLLTKRRLHVQGVDAYRRALSVDPNSYWAHRNLATELFNVGRYAEAIPHYEKAVQWSSNDVSRLDLQLRWIDCHFLIDRGDNLSLPVELPPGDCHVIDQACTSISSVGAARLYVGGVLAGEVDPASINCVFRSGDQELPGILIHARNSIRRLGEITDVTPFAFVCYAAQLDANVPVEVEIFAQSKSIYAASLPVHQTGEGEFAIENLLEAARSSLSAHRCQEAALYYGASEFTGHGLDRIAFAECLIALGHYDEAEWWLTQWMAEASDGPEKGLLIDLLCAELARSRLPGWHANVERLLSTVEDPRSTMSVLTNLGHSRVAYGDLEDAAKFYTRASAIKTDAPQIHFASGIHSAKHALDVRMPARDAKPTIRPQADIAHLFACDGQYFRRFGEKLVASSVAARGDVDLFIHAHIVDPDEEALRIAKALQKSHGLRVSTEETPAAYQDTRVRRAHYTSARFLVAPSLLREYGCPVLVTETDGLINWTWSEILDYVKGADTGYLQAALWNWVPWTKVPAGIVLFAPTPAGIAACDFLASFIDYAFQQEGHGGSDLWTVDQVGLWLAHMNAPKGSRRVHLPMYSMLTLATGDKLNI